MKDLSSYLTSEIKDFLFSELDDGFLIANDLGFLSGVPIPIRQEDLKYFTQSGLSTSKIADNMAIVIGADTGFKYAENYLQYMRKLFDEKLVNVFCGRAEQCIKAESYRKAVCYLRAAVLLVPDGQTSMYCYANGCRLWYQSMEGEDSTELIALLKSEANEYFAVLTSKYPQFAPGWYFLAYAYLNAGAYTKADISFKHYLECSEGQPEEDIKEVKERIEDLKDPVVIEEGQNLLIAGDAEGALEILEPYVFTKYASWWPLHFYLGTAYGELGMYEEAIEGFLRVLKLNPSNYDAMISLSELYEKAGDEEKAKKYSDKAKLVLENSNDND